MERIFFIDIKTNWLSRLGNLAIQLIQKTTLKFRK